MYRSSIPAIAEPPTAATLASSSLNWGCQANLSIYLARESSLVPARFLTAQFLQKKVLSEAFVVM